MTDELSQWVSGHLPNATSIQLTPLKAEASFRQFYRVQSNAAAEQSVILMTSPPDKEHNDQFVRLATIFIDKGIPVPEILATHMRRGWFLMSDLGGADLESAYLTPARDEALTAPIGTLVRLQQIDDPAIPIYS
ncbi:MAG: aminoglycoside phosphotransferase family protein, partial [Pseudomonadales bacterium]